MGRFSIPTLRLAEAGVTLNTVAKALGVTPQAVSNYLAGVRQPHPSLIPVIRALAGDKVADEIAEYLGLEVAQ